MSSAVSFTNLSRHFGETKAVDQVNLEIAEGEFFALLGPSGSGKTTCLRMIAGFEKPDTGHLSIFGQAMHDVPPYRRNVNTVFQDYALFPHLSVAENVAYALKIRKVAKAQRIAEAEKSLQLVRLEGFGDRRPGQLSGGQRQRVALARALISKPKVLLLDEPLGALDLKLREEMQEELKALQRRLGITFVFVTHDQSEAFSMADQVAIFNHGRVVQVGTPQEIYNRPVSRFVASFVGSSNILTTDQLDFLGIHGTLASLRPEAIRFDSSSTIKASVSGKSFLGSSTRLALDLGRFYLNATVDNAFAQSLQEGSEVGLVWEKDAVHLMQDDDA